MQAEGSDCVCEFLGECSFFDRHAGFDHTIRKVQQIFCRSGKVNCARYAVYRELGEDHMPHDLLPFDHLSADTLVAEKEKVPG